jgi:hypothetical protein
MALASAWVPVVGTTRKRKGRFRRQSTDVLASCAPGGSLRSAVHSAPLFEMPVETSVDLPVV